MGSSIWGTMKARHWSKIVEFYQSLDRSDMLPMTQLVIAIAASSYGQKIYGTTSLLTLYISQHQEFELDCNMLRVDFSKGLFTFTYKESPFSRKDWQKECERNEGFRTFEHVMHCLRWFLNLEEGEIEPDRLLYWGERDV
jgi:hypothetical protein